ncbi:hypothetical protein ABZ832_12605 [Streptantibioticus parmotrematis]|uniref:hypothetical protein n=1 Tax=Streptantibioticus parmotrematis TaxID=2873249 RepID=UPI00340CB720
MRHHIPPRPPAEAPVTTAHPNFSQAVASSSGLRRALRNAGINCLDPVVDDETPARRPVVHIKYLDGSAAALLAALLRAGSNPGSETALPTPLVLESMASEQTVAVRNDLQSVLADAGISGLTQVEPHPRTGIPVMHLKHLEGSAVATLVSLLRAGMRDHFATADALHAAFRAHGLNAGSHFPVPVVRQLRICLGEISVHTALALGSLLGAAPFPTELTEVPDYPESQLVMDRLYEAVKTTTSGFMDVQLHPNCMKCGHSPTISLGAFKLNMAKRLVEALRSADEQS